ncbi:transglutaminase family protein, partial [Acinetobacter baumannii]
LLHYGQGKWYPGESLPRWAFGLYWRKDGNPIWKNADLIATIGSPGKADIADAERLAEGTAKRLGLRSGYVMPAWEDPAYWIEREAALPANVSPAD